ncbi:zinc finger protein [Rutstroemia sp. NJR-2017a WRK4]|nr:zinc finger protein [Rutstroemia sp. NJR-2017a WRK4]
MASRLDAIVHGGNFEQTHKAQGQFSEFTFEYEQSPIRMDDERRKTVYTWLKPADMENEQYYLKEIRNRCSLGAIPGGWLLDHMTFKEWFDPQFTALPTLLWLHGHPGVGKSVLASLVIEEAQNLSPKPIVLFFYFKQGNDDRDTFVSMARTLLAQLLQQDTGILDYMYNSCCKSGEPFLNSRSLIEELLLFALSNCDSAYIILDGLDECASRDERKTIVGFFRKIIENHDGDQDADRLRCMFVSRKDSARKDFSGLAEISVDLEKNEDDIDAFCQFRSHELGENLGLPEDRLKEIASVVSAFAHGMFLVAELVWINLCGQSSIDGLDSELESLPTDLDRLEETYKKIMRTILKKPVKAQREEAKLLLSWLIHAKRPLKFHEVQTMKSINLKKGEVEFEKRHFRVRPEELCESLVRVRRDGSIELVHSTAKNKDLDGTANELGLATLCVNYLNLPIFNKPFSSHTVIDGSYGFMEYAVLNWMRHLEAGLSAEPGPNESTRDFCESFKVLLESHWRMPTIEPKVSKRTRDKLQIFETEPEHKKIQQAVASTQEQIKRFGDMRTGECALDLAEIVAGIRVQIESVVLNDADWSTDESLGHELEHKYGKNLFKCPRFSCKYFTDGFASKEERGSHIQRHERPFRCTDIHCTGFIGFAKEEQLTRHRKETHPDHTNQDSFPTEDEIAESQKEYVPETAVELEETPPTIAKVPDADADANAESDSESESESDKVAQPPIASRPAKRTKTETEFKCLHCDKTFTKRWNRDSHLRTHGVGEQFRCHICGKYVARQSDLKRHMKLHDKVKPFTCGGTLRNGQSWGCKQSFQRADILSNHHNSKKGQECIAPREEEERAQAAAYMFPLN